MGTDIQMDWRTVGRAVLAGVIAGLIAGGVAFVVSQSLPKGYAAQSQVLVGSLTATNTNELDAYHQLAQTYAHIATSEPLLERVRNQLALNVDAAEMASWVNAQATGQGIVVIDATAPSGDDAARIANTVASQILGLATPQGQTTSIAQVIQPAFPPERASTPNVPVNTLVAAFLGFFLGMGATLLAATRRAAAVPTPEATAIIWPERP